MLVRVQKWINPKTHMDYEVELLHNLWFSVYGLIKQSEIQLISNILSNKKIPEHKVTTWSTAMMN